MRSLKTLAIVAGAIFLLSAGTAIAAPIFTYEPTLLPQSDNKFDLGTSSDAWRNVYVHNINVTGSCTGCGSGSQAVTSVFGRTGDVTAQSGDYTASQLTGFGVPFYTFFHATTTDALTQGSTNKYWSQTLFDNALTATTTLPALTTLANLSTIKTSITGLLKASSGVLSAATNGTDFTLNTAKTCNSGDFVSAVTAAGVFTCTTPSGTTYSAGTGLTLTTGTFSVNTSQNIATLSNLTGNGFVKTSGGTGTLSIDTNTYLTANQTITLSGDVSGSGATAITTAIGANKVTLGDIAQVAANTILANKTGATGNVAALATSSLGIALSDTTGTLAAAKGGTGQSAYTTGDVLYASGSTALSKLGIGSPGQVLGVIAGVPAWVATSTTAFTNTIANGGTATTTFYSGGVVFSDGTKLTQAPNSTNNILWYDGTLGNLGVGSSSPTAPLVVQGANGSAEIIFGSSAANSQTGSIQATTAGVASFVGSSNTQIKSMTGAIQFFPNNSEAARFSSNGNFGIATTVPFATLAVGGNVVVGASTAGGTMGNLTIGTLSGILKATAGLVSTALVNLASDVTGTLPAANGGTGATSVSSFFSVASNVLTSNEHHSFTYATSTAWTGTTTIPLEVGYGETWATAQCFTDAGTLNVDLYHSTTHLKMFNASTTIGTLSFTSNNTMTAGDQVKVDIGTPASTPTRITCTERDTY